MMEKFGFHKVSNNPGPGQPSITHSRPLRSSSSSHSSSQSHIKKRLQVANCPSNAVALANAVAVHPAEFDLPDKSTIALDGDFVYTLHKDASMEPGTIGLAGNVRTWGKWSLGQTIKVESYNIFEKSQHSYLGSIEMSIDFRSKSRADSTPINHEELCQIFLLNYENQVLQPTQPIVMDFKGNIFALLVNVVEILDVDKNLPIIKNSTDLGSKGILVKLTEINFFPYPDSKVNLIKKNGSKSRSSRPRAKKNIINPDFKLEDLGIGGLDDEFQDIFRRAFNSRILPPDIAEKLDYKHCKGLLLYGPPGTGKTLIARNLSKMLNGKEPKIVNGPEMLSKYVGASEENIRNLFKDAEAEYKQKGDESDLHVIIFDELDSVFKQRGLAKSDGTGVGDNVVNQLLSKMDGVDQLNNILVIGMTNRLDLIDSALLRPGRFEIQIEISLPDEKGRKDILLIHTAKLRENKLLDKDVDFDELSRLTKNFTGAELEGLCNSAKSFAISRHTKKGSIAQFDLDAINKMKITRNDFLLALNEVKPAFGTDEEDLTGLAPHGIIPYNASVTSIFNRGQSFIDEVKSSETETLISILLHGPIGVGKTAVASTLALNSDFPFIKVLSAESLLGMSEPSKIQYIDNVFRDVYKSPLNILVIDKIENIINYVPIGPRFSNDILQMLMVYITKRPPKNRRLLIIGTTSQYSVLKHMNFVDCFTSAIGILPMTTVEEAERVMNKLGFMLETERHEIVQELSRYELNISIKKFIQVLMNCRYLGSDVAGVVESVVEQNT
ncbi:uncharacterized protein PRCAT00000872001 [Priceomyces carsonii]|uniref:uncharacterized protein n=1 Tax=Priceomyces carsonii TaxID=28549 RepID=UPI002ED9AE69|nr:unnamed protein product [Priceomyces carsonii]